MLDKSEYKTSDQDYPPSVEQIKTTILNTVEGLIVFCRSKRCKNDIFFNMEKELSIRISALACLFFQLFLTSFHEQFNYFNGQKIKLQVGDFHQTPTNVCM